MKGCFFLFFSFWFVSINSFSQGCTEGDCANGSGTYVYNDGTKYVGTFKDTKADGHGVCYFANGTTFIGEWANHLATGYGTWFYQDGAKQTGHYKDNVFIDHSQLTPGCLSGDCANGFGTYLWEGGTLYVGQFKNYKLDGMGTCYFNDGSKYVGEWLNDRFNGMGTNYVRDGSIQKGQWRDHQFLGEEQTLNCVSGNCDNGFGIYKYGEKGTYIGEFKESYRDGYGTYYFPSGDKYVGMWKRGNFEGQGTYTYANGTVNSGLWKDHQLVSEVTTEKLGAEISWDEPLSANSSSAYNKVTIKACIKSPTDVRKITVLLNGKTFSTDTSISGDPVSGCTVSFTKTIDLSIGSNQVIINVENNAGLSQSTERIINYIAPSKQRRLALVIGNATYQHTTQLRNPVNDARSMARTLEGQGFKVIKIENATGRDMKVAIDNFGRELGDYDVGLFYYAGHGLQDKGLNYLVPIDADLKSEAQIDYDCVQANRIVSFMEVAGTDVNIIILDACRNNPFKSSWSRSTAGDGLVFMNAPTGTLIAYATAPGMTAADGVGNNGLYTESLLTEITNPDLTILQVFQRVRARVAEQSAKRQIPWESTSLIGDFYFGKN